MHIHVPKGLHSWGAVAREIGVITVGVLIALFLEQMLEDREWHRKVRAAEAGMRHELFWDNGPQIYQRAAMASVRGRPAEPDPRRGRAR